MKPIAVAGIATSMEDEFPFKDENSGNMIHGMAPFELFANAVDVRRSGWRRYFWAPDVTSFINEQCSHYVYSFANFIQFENHRPTKKAAYLKMIELLDKSEVPVIPLGIGAQASDMDSAKLEDLPEEAIQFMKFLGEKCELISVRGEFTARVFKEFAGVENTLVTGCPSFFSRPAAFQQLREFLKSPDRQLGVSFNATKLNEPRESRLMLRSVFQDHFWIEVHDPSTHEFALQALENPEQAVVPPYWNRYINGPRPRISRAELTAHFGRRYRLFRDVRPWYQFHREQTRFTFGTRFHGNMASLLAGRPALWVTHDSRTVELVETLHLPHISLDEAVDTPTPELELLANYEETFDHLSGMYRVFNEFLEHYGLPEVKVPF